MWLIERLKNYWCWIQIHLHTESFDEIFSQLKLRLEMFQLTLMGKSDAVIESFFINMHARCVQVLNNGSESRGFNLGKLKKKKETYH